MRYMVSCGRLQKLAKAYLRLFEDAISAPAAILYDRKYLLSYNGNGILPTTYVILKYGA